MTNNYYKCHVLKQWVHGLGADEPTCTPLVTPLVDYYTLITSTTHDIKLYL